MKFSSENYYHAAVERMEQAHVLYRHASSYALTMYVAGVAVECMLRAFKLRRDPSFDERHNLLRLFKASGMLQLDEAGMIAKGRSSDDASKYAASLRVAVEEIYSLWFNDYRYASEKRLRAELIKMNRHRGIKGEVLKANVLQLATAAAKFIERGVILWGISGKE